MSQALPRLARLAALQAFRSAGLSSGSLPPTIGLPLNTPSKLGFAARGESPSWGLMSIRRLRQHSEQESGRLGAYAVGSAAEAEYSAAARQSRLIGNILKGSFAVGIAFSFIIFSSKLPQSPALTAQQQFAATPKEPVKDYPAVRSAIAEVMEAPEYDDGSYGPIFVRLAWHTSGTYDKASGTGGSNGATMRFAPECNHQANAGLEVARQRLEPVKEFFSWMSYADLWTLAGAVAVEEMGGPHIPWRPVRVDHINGDNAPMDGRLPDASKGAAHVKEVFGRMGFSEKETVALIGAHSLGRCHASRSGYEGPWTNAPTTFSNLYFKELLENKWTKKKWKGPEQYEDKSKQLMMTPSDMSLIWDKSLRKHVEEYAKDEDAFFRDFASAFSRLLELGVTFPEGTPAAA